MQRRQFLVAAAATAAAQTRKPIRIAFLGGGHGHARAKIALARDSPDWELVGLYEPDAALMATYTKMGVRELSLDQILNDSTITVAGVESWVWDLSTLAIKALQAGKHIHLDKPPASTLDDLKAILELAARRKLLVQMGYMWRYNPAVNRALKAARDGQLGDIFQVRGLINTTIPPEERRKLARFKGGQMFELGGHLIDPIVRLMGPPVRVTPYLRHDHHSLDDGLADNTMAVLEWDRAMGTVTTASMHFRNERGGNAGALPYRALELYGTRGAAIVRPIESPATLHISLSGAAAPTTETFPYTRYVDDFVELAAAVRGERALSINPAEDLLVQQTLLRASGMEGA